MALGNTRERWGSLSMIFHWIIVVLIIAQFVLANMAEHASLLGKLALLARHKSVGITILGLAVLRLGWLAVNRGHNPSLPADLKGYERFLAHLTHKGLYLLLFALPLTGWVMSSAKNFPVSWFGYVTLPDFVAPNEALFDALEDVHGMLAGALMVLVALHVVAALAHHWVRKDDVLRRMLPLVMALLIAPQTFAAAPAQWSADPGKSTLEFQFLQAGAKTTGSFAKFSAAVSFDPANPASGKIDVSIDMASVDTRDKDRNDALKSKDLLDSVSFMRSTYVAAQITPQGNGFTAMGKLTLRGVTKDVPISFTFEPGSEGGKPVATMKGSATVQRLAFGVGQGEWKSTDWVGDEVQVMFNLLLRQ
jgi:cytochrome b561